MNQLKPIPVDQFADELSKLLRSPAGQRALDFLSLRETPHDFMEYGNLLCAIEITTERKTLSKVRRFSSKPKNRPMRRSYLNTLEFVQEVLANPKEEVVTCTTPQQVFDFIVLVADRIAGPKN